MSPLLPDQDAIPDCPPIDGKSLAGSNGHKGNEDLNAPAALSSDDLHDGAPDPAAPDSPPSQDTGKPLAADESPHARQFSLPARWAALLAVTLFLAAVLMVIPRPWSTILLAALSVVTMVAAIYEQRREAVLGFIRRARHELGQIFLFRALSPAPEQSEAAVAARQRIPLLLLITELGIIFGAGCIASAPFATLNEDLKLHGYEGEWLVSSAHFAANSLHEYGYIPLWQPYLEMGEPLVDNPFSFVLNPISVGPSLLLGAANGIKISVVLYTIFAGLGGWVLGRVLGLGLVGRMLLGLLLIGKGNMQAMIGQGYFQLGVTQAYIPWVVAGTIATLRFQSKRWPIVLTALTFTLLFFGGNIWYTLPVLISILVLALLYVIDLRVRAIDRAAIRRLVFAGLLTLGLSAITLLPIWMHRDRIGSHTPDQNAGAQVEIVDILEQYFNGDYALYENRIAPGEVQFYYSYVTPLWFVLLIFVILPVGWQFRQPNGRIWVVGVSLAVFFTIWGAGGNPVMIWLYRHVPLLDQWRFVGRALAAASFWIAVLVAMRVDALWRVILLPRWRQVPNRINAAFFRLAAPALALLLLVAAGAAARQVLGSWRAAPYPVNTYDAACVEWLREQNPTAELAVNRSGYDSITSLLDYHVRKFDIEADFSVIPDPDTVIGVSDALLAPRYGIAWDPEARAGFRQGGYVELEDSPNPIDRHHCVWERSSVSSYAFSVPMRAVSSTTLITADLTTPETRLHRLPDDITVWVDNRAEDTLLVVQERAYPGWQVHVDGKPADLEVSSGLIAVIVPSGGDGVNQHEVEFRYRPPLVHIGGGITLATAAFCALFLLNGDRQIMNVLRQIRKPDAPQA